MSTQPAEPQPAYTPHGLFTALARVAPHRVVEMERQKSEAFSLAAEHNDVAPIRQWLTIWAAEVEIERRPDLAARRGEAVHTVNTLDKDSPAWRASMEEIVAVVNEAREGVRVVVAPIERMLDDAFSEVGGAEVTPRK
ncbi:hypothetical protein LRS74_20775 [Streptomyces sp. LX-29]|uniref:hypothetical protein n=1 Tax=Streptomyces sp. LX-29 TaxID=2900152 RepID=UPI00240E10E8|nr:hypothetical protein [Streptomyces sp. LX-29]WFB09200.1 hypothetical protein LRS74_20775 [Streptomyces sp. LX-29]